MAFKRTKKEKEVKAGEETMISDPNEPKIRSTLQMLPLLFTEIPTVILGCIGSSGMGAVPILLYLVMGKLIDTFSAAATPSTSPIVNAATGILQSAMFVVQINSLALKMTYIAIGAGVSGFLSTFFLNVAHDRMGTRIKSKYFRSLLDQEIGYFDMKRTGELLSNMTESLEVIQDAMSIKVGKLVECLIQFALGIIMALIAGWKMTLVMLATSPLLVGLIGFAGIATQGFTKKISDHNAVAANISNEVISSMRTIRSMDGEDKEKERFDAKLSGSNVLFAFKAATLGFGVGAAVFVVFGVIGLAFWYGGRIVINGEMTVGEMFQVFGYVMMGVLGLSNALQVLPDFAKANHSMISVLKVIRRIPLLRPSGGITPNQIEGKLEFRSVNFSYPTRPNVQVLKDFTLDILPGQSVALVGASGSGKSTIVGLIERFYSQNSGTILLDGVDITEIDPRWLHRNIGIVTQEPTLFATTIKNNILYAVSGKNVTDEEIIKASQAANAHDFIAALPDGYNTVLGERGVSLSGGQKQRIAIARAMIQNPSLLLLDEATSALDTQSEALVQDALNNLMQGRTSIVIAHRLSTIVDSDVICVMHKGEMKEKGTHSELLQIKDGYYFKLAQKQMKFSETPAKQPELSTSSEDLSDTEE